MGMAMSWQDYTFNPGSPFLLASSCPAVTMTLRLFQHSLICSITRFRSTTRAVAKRVVKYYRIS